MFRPQFDGHKCSLGYLALDWIHAFECHGPGDVQGEPLDYDDEMRDFVIDAYTIDKFTGLRVYDEAVLSRAKGRAKSETAGHIGVLEAFGPCRFDGWARGGEPYPILGVREDDAYLPGEPMGRRVTSPLLKALATEESQAGNTFENIAFIAGTWGPEVHPEIYAGVGGIRRYQSATALYLPDGGEIRACTAGSASKDGGKETWVCADETHLYIVQELRNMYGTVRRNLGKRKIAQPWLLQTSTAYRPGENSVFEATLTAWRKGELSSSVLVDHREARGRIDLNDEAHTMAQLRQVYGAAAAWMDLPRLYREMRDPRSCPDDATAARYFLNRPLSTKDSWIPLDVVERQSWKDVVKAGESICLGFDGSLNEDSTVLIGSRMSDGFLFPVGIWAKPTGAEGQWWEVPRLEVLASIREAFGRYDVVRMYADPHEWRSDIDTLAGEFGEKRVVPWETRRDLQMAAALDRLHADLMMEQVCHSGDPVVVEHFGNAYVRRRGRMRLVRKENEESSRKIDSVVGAALAYESRADALAAGWVPSKPKQRMIVN